MFRSNRWNLFKESLCVWCRRISEVTTGWWRCTTARTRSGQWTCSHCPAPGWPWWWPSVGTWSCVVHCTHEATSVCVELVVPCWPCSFSRPWSTSLVYCATLSSQVHARSSTRPSSTRRTTATAFSTTRQVSMLCETGRGVKQETKTDSKSTFFPKRIEYFRPPVISLRSWNPVSSIPLFHHLQISSLSSSSSSSSSSFLHSFIPGSKLLVIGFPSSLPKVGATRQFFLSFASVALEVYLYTTMRYINRRFTYLLLSCTPRESDQSNL